MKALKILIILLGVYIGIVVVFESLLGYFQPANQSTHVITTINDDGVKNDRVLARIVSGDQLYVAANHWPRAWFNHAKANPNVEITFEGVTASYTAVLISGAEHERINNEHALGPVFRALTGFPPRYLMRLDPR